MEVQHNPLTHVSLRSMFNSVMAGFSPLREKRRAEWPFCELCYNSHPVIIFGPPSMTIRRVWDSLGIHPESVRNPAHLIGPSTRLMDWFMSRFMVRDNEHEMANGLTALSGH